MFFWVKCLWCKKCKPEYRYLVDGKIIKLCGRCMVQAERRVLVRHKKWRI